MTAELILQGQQEPAAVHSITFKELSHNILLCNFSTDIFSSFCKLLKKLIRSKIKALSYTAYIFSFVNLKIQTVFR